MSHLSHLIMAPIILPLLLVGLLVLLGTRSTAERLALGDGGDPPRVGLQRVISLIGVVLNLVIGIALLVRSMSGEVEVYNIGDWRPPFGIVLVLDRLSALMIVLTGVVATIALIAACRRTDREGPYFHAVFFLLLVGVQGAFLTGDIFNLFVFFELSLLSTYILLMHGAGVQRVKAGLHYVTMNLAGSSLFLIALGLLYAFTGTLSMTDMADKVANLDPADAVFVEVGALLLLVVFGIKAAMAPLYFWLPNTYAAASAPVAALFSIMTKVGIYAIIRVYNQIFGEGAGALEHVAQPWLMPLALTTVALAALGAMASRDLRALAGHLVIVSVGTILAAVSLFDGKSLGAALYYMVHSTLSMAALYLLIDLIRRARVGLDDACVGGAPVRQTALIGSTYFVLAMVVAGVPPLSGFLGKLFVLQTVATASPDIELTYVTWTIILGGSLFALIALSRAGSYIFWKTDADPHAIVAASPPLDDDARSRPVDGLDMAPVFLFLACVVAWTFFAEPIRDFLDATAQQVIGGSVSLNVSEPSS